MTNTALSGPAHGGCKAGPSNRVPGWETRALRPAKNDTFCFLPGSRGSRAFIKRVQGLFCPPLFDPVLCSPRTPGVRVLWVLLPGTHPIRLHSAAESPRGAEKPPQKAYFELRMLSSQIRFVTRSAFQREVLSHSLLKSCVNHETITTIWNNWQFSTRQTYFTSLMSAGAEKSCFRTTSRIPGKPAVPITQPSLRLQKQSATSTIRDFLIVLLGCHFCLLTG